MALDQVTSNLAVVVDRLEGALATRLKELSGTVAALQVERDALRESASVIPAHGDSPSAAYLELEARHQSDTMEFTSARTAWHNEKKEILAHHEGAIQNHADTSVQNQMALDQHISQIKQLTAEKAELTATLSDAMVTVDEILASLKGKVAL
jgi:chromosome segregation ATPase